MEILKNYKEFKKKIEAIKNSGIKPTILVHACCGPCSSEVIAFLKEYFQISIYYSNSNIFPKDEFEKRYLEFSKFDDSIKIIKGNYDSNEYFKAIDGYEHLEEFSERCYHCYKLRIEKTAKYAKEKGYDFYTTSLSISPYKKSKWINQIGYEMAEKYGIEFLYSDFKKEDGYKKSIILAREYEMYRQEYCGCEMSLDALYERKEKEVSK